MTTEGTGSDGTPELSVVVPSHDRPVRLRWLLNALERQTASRDSFELIVTHDSSGPETEELLRSHPLAEARVLRHITLPAGSAPPGRQRNVGCRAARAPVIAFTDDDCRPPDDWVERALQAARRHPGAIVQGTTRPEPAEEPLLSAAPWARSQNIDPPTPHAQTCNLLYPKAVLERVGGFEEELQSGEDQDLAWRAVEQGTPFVAAPEMLTFHAVETNSLISRLRWLRRWRDLPFSVKRHPQLRQVLYLGVFWKPTHVWLPVAVLGAAKARRRPLWALATLPYLLHATPGHGHDVRGRVRSLAELPGRVAVDSVEMAAMVEGSLRHRTLML